MKDKKFILGLNTENINLKGVQDILVKNGWFFKYVQVGNKVRIKVYLLEEDFDFFKEDPFYTVRANTKEEAFKLFLIDTKEKYGLI